MRPSESPETSIIPGAKPYAARRSLAGVALSPEWLRVVGRAQSRRRRPTSRRRRPRTLAAAADRILPRTDTPGAADVGVPAFIDRLYGEFMTPAEQQLLTQGVQEIDAAAKSAHGSGFSTLSTTQQDAVLRTIATAQQDRDPGSFALIRSATILGYFTSEQVGRNVLHYDPVPGAYNGCVPIDQVGRRNWTT